MDALNMSALLVLLLCIFTTKSNAGFGHEDPNLNIFSDWDFEDWNKTDCAANKDTEWFCHDSKVSPTSDSYTGNQALLIFNRTETNGGLRRRIYGLKNNTHYYFSVFIKLLVDPADYYDVLVVRKTVFDTDPANIYSFAHQKFVSRVDTNNWLHIGGDFLTPETTTKYVEFYLRDIPTEVEFVVDTASLVEITTNSNWKAEADQRIQQIRKNTFTLTGTVPAVYDPALIEIEAILRKQEFCFGAALKANVFNQNKDYNKAYRGFFYENFNCAVIENAMKWYIMEKTQYNIKFSKVTNAINTLRANGIDVRGHNILWNKAVNNAAYLQQLVGDEMLTEVNRRLDYLVNTYKDDIINWDVLNEHLTERFFDGAVNDPEFILNVFHNLTVIDSDIQMFLNEYDIVKNPGKSTAAVGNLARYLDDNNASLAGIGIHSHQTEYPIYEELIQKRLDIVANTGKRMWITELSINLADVTERAEHLDSLMRIYYSNDNIDGILHWGFSDLKIYDVNAALAEGSNVVPNAAGDVWHKLVKEDWNTTETVTPLSATFSVPVSGFHGDYDLFVRYNGTLLNSATFHLTKGQNMNVIVPFP